jgi:hypothetical protein
MAAVADRALFTVSCRPSNVIAGDGIVKLAAVTLDVATASTNTVSSVKVDASSASLASKFS